MKFNNYLEKCQNNDVISYQNCFLNNEILLKVGELKNAIITAFKGAIPKILKIDHIIPLAQGGANDISNLQTLCSACNQKKKHHFDPRFDRHFKI